jgi:hypothetical protein
VTEVGGFHGWAFLHSVSANARLCTIQSKKPSKVTLRGVGSVKIGGGLVSPGGVRIGFHASSGVAPSGTTSSTGPWPLRRMTCTYPASRPM